MKFTKDDACKDLMSQIPTKGETLQLSERSINEQLETLMPLLANDETELADFVNSVLPIFRTADANVRANVSAQVKEYKEKNPVVVKTVEEPKNDEAMSKALARIEELERKNAENEKKVKLSERRSEIVSKMKEKGVKDKEWIDDFLDQVSYDGEDFDVEAKVESYVKMYNKSLAIVDNDYTPRGARGKNGENKELDDVIKGASDFLKAQRLS